MQLLESICSYTRMMGAFSILINWMNEDRIISHIFLMDSEGLGVVEFFELVDSPLIEVKSKFMKVSGGLGGDISSIDGRIAMDVVRKYIVKNLQYNKPLPKTLNDEIVTFYYEMQTNISKEASFRGIISDIESEKEFVNYMIMRLVAKDREAIEYFSGGRGEYLDIGLTDINGALIATDLKKKKEGVYFCTVYFEEKYKYYRADMAISIERYNNQFPKINGFDEHFFLRSVVLASKGEVEGKIVHDIISRPESIFVYDIKPDVDMGIEYIISIIRDKFEEIQEIDIDGRIFFTEFVHNNSHVDSYRYRINEDIMFNIYIIGDRLYLGASFENYAIAKYVIERDLGEYLTLYDEFEFNYSLIYEFAVSGYDDIYDFLNE